MMRVKKTAEEVQEQIKNAIPDDDGFIDLPVFRCLPAREEGSVLDEKEKKEENGLVASLIRKVKVLK